MRRLTLIGGVLIFIISSGAEAQERKSVLTLHEVTVVGQKEDNSVVVPDAAAAKENIKNVAGGVDVIAGETYKTGRAATPQDMLGYSPGIFVQQRDTGAQESRLSIRGSGLQRTFHLRGITLLQDGVPLNQADGAGDFYKIEPLATDYVEVFRGGNALRYGATTLGGAINFVSPTGYEASPLSGRFEGGSFGYLRSQISSGQVLGPVDYYFSASQFKQDGFRRHTDQDNHYEFMNLGYRLSEDLETRLYVTNAVTKAKLGGALRKSQMQDDPRQANASSVSGNQKRDVNFYRFASKTTYLRDEHRWDVSLYMYSGELFHPIFQVLEQDTRDYGGEIRYTNTADLGDQENTLVLGIQPAVGTIQDDRFVNSGGSKGSRTAQSDQVARNLNVYAENQWHFADRWTLVPGMQLVYASRQSTDYFLANGDDSGNAVYRAINPKIGLLHDFQEGQQAFLGYNRGFEPPTFSELFDQAANFLPNKAQRSDTVETGARGQGESFAYDATLYYSRLQKELLSLSDGSGNPLGTINARGTTIHRGLELGGGVDLVRGLISGRDAQKDKVVLRGIYNWGDFYFDGDPVYGKNQLPGLPEHFVKFELMYEHPAGFYAGPNVERVVTKYPIDMANTFYADPYTVWGMKAGYRTGQGLAVFIEGKNLGGKIYAASTGIVNNAAGGDTNAVFNPGNGRAWYGGVDWSW